ncbi:Na+/H+ antiporter NhaA [Leeia oryzae]|uniref:Na+/H+ antiporter NhaA n=1 Tax=Leeia oryzae TaxID=356662 RepID=UPI0003734662|nr:Na+/H+ antiporter NhaA [Leeia oryzae]
METLKESNLRLRKRLVKLAGMVRLARYSANHDVLTGLPNRRLFHDRLGQAMAIAERQQRQLAVLMIDLDDFKAINDRLGHDAGDQLLQQLAKRLTSNLRATDTASRLGGDEFAIMLPEIKGKTSIAVVIAKVRKSLAVPYRIADESLAVGASIGVAVYKDHQQLGQLIEQADLEMYRSKQIRHGLPITASHHRKPTTLKKRISLPILRKHRPAKYRSSQPKRQHKALGSMNKVLASLPAEPVDLFTKSFTRFLHIEATAGAALLFCALLALALSNSPWSIPFLSFWDQPLGVRLGPLVLTHSLKHWINNGLMTLFFFMGTLELKREMVQGELRNLRMAALSLAGALGGMIMPAMLFWALEGRGTGAHGWGTVMATDTAFLIGCLAILGPRIPQSLRLFLLSLAIFDDIGAILVVAIGYGTALNGQALGLVAVGLAMVAGMSRLGIRSLLMYAIAGVAIWLALDVSGLHPTLAGLILGLMTPAQSWVSDSRLHAILARVMAYPLGNHWQGNTPDRLDLRRASIATREALPPVERLEVALHPWVAYAVIPLFALANAGLPINFQAADGALTLAIFAGFVFGKPAGVMLFSYLAVRLGLALRPLELSWQLMAAGSLLTGIGFTMALLIAELAFGPALLNAAKLGILGASIVSATAGLSVLAWLTTPKRLQVAEQRPPTVLGDPMLASARAA